MTGSARGVKAAARRGCDAWGRWYAWAEPVRRTGAVVRRGCRSAVHPAHQSPEVAVNLKKVVTWVIVAFVIFYVIQAPERSAAVVKSAGHALGDAASSLAAFVGSLL